MFAVIGARPLALGSPSISFTEATLRLSLSRAPSSSSILIMVMTCGELSRTRSWHRRISGITRSHSPSIQVPDGVNWYGNPDVSINEMAGAIALLMCWPLPNGMIVNSANMVAPLREAFLVKRISSIRARDERRETRSE